MLGTYNVCLEEKRVVWVGEQVVYKGQSDDEAKYRRGN